MEGQKKISLSDKMAKLVYFRRSLIWGLVCLGLSLSFFLSSLLLYRMLEHNYEEMLAHPNYFDSYSSTGYSTITLQFMTDSFAEHMDEGYLLYFGFDTTLKPVIFCVEGDLPGDLQALLDYTYSEEMEAPGPVEIQGFCRPLNSEIMGFARETYSRLWNENEQLSISAQELSQVVGDYFLDTRPSTFQGENGWAIGLFFFPLLFFFAGIVLLFRYWKELKRCQKRMEGLSPWLPQAEAEFQAAQPVKKGLPLYFTDNFVITSVYYFNLIPYAQIRYLSENLDILMAEMKDGQNHIIIERYKCRRQYEQLKEELKARIQAAKERQKQEQPMENDPMQGERRPMEIEQVQEEQQKRDCTEEKSTLEKTKGGTTHMQLYPAIDLKNGQCVRLRQGEFKEVTVYSDTPEKVARYWQEQGATFLHLVDLDGALAGHSVNEPVIRRIAQTVSIPIQIGGGIRTREDVERMLSLGVKRVIIGTKAAERPEFLKELAEEFGAEAIVAGIDAKDGFVAVQGWEQVSQITAISLAMKMKEYGIQHIVYTDISKDGMLSGPNVEATKAMTEATGLDVIASGGVSSMDDLEKLSREGIRGAIIGKALYENRIDLKEAVAQYQ